MPLYGPKFPLSSGNEDAFELYETVEGQIAFYLLLTRFEEQEAEALKKEHKRCMIL